MKQQEGQAKSEQEDLDIYKIIPSIAQNIKKQPLIQKRKIKLFDTSTNDNKLQSAIKVENVSKTSILSSFFSKNKANLVVADPQANNKDQNIGISQQTVKEQQTSYFNDFFHMMRTKFKMRQIISKTESRRLKDLNENHLSIIHDKASQCYLNEENIKSYNIISKKRRKILKNQSKKKNIFSLLFRLPTLNPANQVVMIWSLFQFIWFFILGISISLKMAFQAQMDDIISNSVYKTIILFFFLDMYVKLNTGFYQLGHYYKQKSLILRYYLRKNLLRDFLTLFNLCLYYFIQNDVSNEYTSPFNIILVIGCVCKFKQIKKIFEKIEEQINNKLKSTHFTDLFKLLFTMLLVGHLFSCVWISIAKIVPLYVDDKLPTWFDLRKNMDNSWRQQYLNAFYFSSVTMITVGYGDITPQNNYEILLCLFTLFIACCVFAYTVNSIGHIINEIQQKNTQNKQKINIIFNYMKQKNISRDMQYEVQQYLEYIWRETYARNTEQEEKIIQTLNSNLRQRLLIEANKMVLQDSPIFRNNFSDLVLERTVSLIKEKRYSPEEIIFRLNETGDSNIYFIETGKVQLYSEINYPGGEKKIQIIQCLEKGQSFGHYSFFTGQPRMVNVRTQGFVTLLSIDRNSFVNLLQEEYQEDYEQFCEIKEEVLYQSMYNKIGKFFSKKRELKGKNMSYLIQFLGLSCYSCGKSDHLVNKCRLVHHQAQIEYVIAQQNFKQLKRQNHTRSTKPKYRCLVDFERINTLQYQFCQQNYELMMLYCEVFLNFDNKIDSFDEESDQESHDSSIDISQKERKKNEQMIRFIESVNNIDCTNNNDFNNEKDIDNNIKKLSLTIQSPQEYSKESTQCIQNKEKTDGLSSNNFILQDSPLSRPKNIAYLNQGLENSIKLISSTCIENNEEVVSSKERNIGAIKAFQSQFPNINNNQNSFIEQPFNALNQINQCAFVQNLAKSISLTQFQDRITDRKKTKKLTTNISMKDQNNILDKQGDSKNANDKYVQITNSSKQIEGEPNKPPRISLIKRKLSSAMKKVLNKKPAIYSTIEAAIKQNRRQTKDQIVSPLDLQLILNEKKAQQASIQELKELNTVQSDHGFQYFNKFQKNTQIDLIDKQKNFKNYFPQWNLNFIVYKINLPLKYQKEYKKNLRDNAIKFVNNQNNNYGQMMNQDHQDLQFNKFKELKRNDFLCQSDVINKNLKIKQNLLQGNNKKSNFIRKSQSKNIAQLISEQSSILDEQSEEKSKHFQKEINSQFKTQVQPDCSDELLKIQNTQLIELNSKQQAEDFLNLDQTTTPHAQLHTSFNEKIESEACINASFYRQNVFKKKNSYQF